MNVKEDYGELSSIARSVHVNYTIVVPPFSCCLFHVPFPLGAAAPALRRRSGDAQ